jgi:hypothetical protein
MDRQEVRQISESRSMAAATNSTNTSAAGGFGSRAILPTAGELRQPSQSPRASGAVDARPPVGRNGALPLAGQAPPEALGAGVQCGKRHSLAVPFPVGGCSEW